MDCSPSQAKLTVMQHQVNHELYLPAWYHAVYQHSTALLVLALRQVSDVSLQPPEKGSQRQIHCGLLILDKHILLTAV